MTHTLPRRRLLGGASVLAAASLLGCTASSDISPDPPDPAAPSEAPTPTPTPTPTPALTDPLPAGPFTVLVAGTDTWQDPTTGRPDALLVAQLTAARDHVALVSIPRDAWVPIDGGRDGKINSAYGGDIERLTRTVSGVLGGLPIHATALTGFAGYTAIVEALGSFEVDNAIESSFTDPTDGHVSHFPAGRITLTPADWLVYARQRKGLPRGDLDRTARHRAILVGMLRRLRALAAADPAGLAAVASAAAAQVRTTGLLSAEVALALAARAGAGAGPDDVTTLMVPVAGFGTRGAQSVTLLDATKTADLAAALATGDVRDYAARTAGDPATR